VGSDPNEFHVVAFDPGGHIGWAALSFDLRAFSRPENKVLRYLKRWECGEFDGPEMDQCRSAEQLIWRTKFGDMPFNAPVDVLSAGLSRADILSEDFELTQLVGGANLLSPVRINAILGYACHKWGIQLNLQRRTMRTGVTAERLQLYGFESPFGRTGKWSTSGKGKDAFAAMQHAVTWVRRLKEESRRKPWKLSNGIVHNAQWDCACEDGKRCDIVHPR
jgi:hypothetical protein